MNKKVLLLCVLVALAIQVADARPGRGNCCNCPLSSVRNKCGCNSRGGGGHGGGYSNNYYGGGSHSNNYNNNYIVPAVATPRGSGTCYDQPDNTCLNRMAGWQQFTCGYAKDWCNSAQYMQAARTCCPYTCGACSSTGSMGMSMAMGSSSSGQCRDQPDNTCLNRHAGWMQYTCAYAREWCNNPNYSAAARECCPATCGVCSGGGKSIVDNAVATSDLSTLVAVLTDPRYSDILAVVSGPGPMTVFAPTNKAFAMAGVDINNVQAVKNVLKYHVVPGVAALSSGLGSFQNVPTAQGQSVEVRKSGSGVTVNNANVVVADVVSTNGVVHVIDRVLMPASAAPALPQMFGFGDATCSDKPDYTCLNTKEGWVEFTCSYARDWCNNPTYSAAARECCPATCGACTSSARPMPKGGMVATSSGGLNSIVENAVATPDLSTLVSLVTLPEFKGILDALSGTGPFTVFAPTNEAFAKAGVDSSDINKVAEVLMYHVIAGAGVAAGDLKKTQFVETLQGEDIFIAKFGGGVTVNGATRVVIPDVYSSNGVVHVVDSVLIPPSLLN